MIFEKEDFKKISKVDADEAKESHERKLYSRKVTLFGPDPSTWDQQDHSLVEKERAGRKEKVDDFEKDLGKLEQEWPNEKRM